MADVDHGGDVGFEVFGAPPLVEGLLYDDMAAVLKEGGAGDESPARLQSEALQPVHHVGGKAFLLGMVVLGALRAVDQKGQLQTAIFCPKHCKNVMKQEGSLALSGPQCCVYFSKTGWDGVNPSSSLHID